MSFISIILARGGSKGIPNKNLSPLYGKLLIDYSIEAAKNSDFCNDCYLSSDSADILNRAETLGAKIIKRPSELAQDDSPIEEAMLQALELIAKEKTLPSWGLLLQPTSPLRSAKDINAAFEALKVSSAKSLISVCEVSQHPYKMLVLDQGFLSPAFSKEALSANRQSLPKAYKQNGAIYFFKIADFIKQKSFFIPDVLPFIMPEQYSIDIDKPEDLIACENILREQDKTK